MLEHWDEIVQFEMQREEESMWIGLFFIDSCMLHLLVYSISLPMESERPKISTIKKYFRLKGRIRRREEKYFSFSSFLSILFWFVIF